MVPNEVRIGCYHLRQIDQNTLQIREGERIFQYQSEYACRLLEAVHLEEHGLLEPKSCNCFVMTGYLVGSEQRLRWPDHGENAVLAAQFPGEKRNDFRAACRDLLFPIAMVARFHDSDVHSHSATLIAGEDPYDCVVAQKRGRGHFELCGYEEFFHYSGTPTSLAFTGKRKPAAPEESPQSGRPGFLSLLRKISPFS